MSLPVFLSATLLQAPAKSQGRARIKFWIFYFNIETLIHHAGHLFGHLSTVLLTVTVQPSVMICIADCFIRVFQYTLCYSYQTKSDCFDTQKVRLSMLVATQHEI